MMRTRYLTKNSMLQHSIGPPDIVTKVIRPGDARLRCWTLAKFANSRKFKITFFEKTQCYAKVQSETNPTVQKSARATNFSKFYSSCKVDAKKKRAIKKMIEKIGRANFREKRNNINNGARTKLGDATCRVISVN